MKEPQTLLRLFEYWIPESMRISLVREAGLKDDRPSILRGLGGLYAPAREWIEQHRTAIAPLILRYIDPPDELIAGLVVDGDLPILPEQQNSHTIILKGSTLSQSDNPGEGFPLANILASSAFMFQAFLDIAAANQACGIQVSHPEIELKKGSLEITVGRGLFASGIGLLVACGTGLVGAPIVGTVAGTGLATVGAIELAINWRKAIAEERKINAETGKIDSERRLTELNIAMKKLELEKALEESKMKERERREPHIILPESAEVPRSTVRHCAETLSMSEAYATHVLNRGLPNLRQAKKMMTGIEISTLPSDKQNL